MDYLELRGEEAEDCNAERICACVAKCFGVRKTEVALLQVHGSLLKFLHPRELTTTGAIPLSSGAVAARTAKTKRPELFNSFTRIKHSSIFEVVRLGENGTDTETIQKLMSAPIFSPQATVVGVIQVSRKAHSAAAAGPDFTSDDLSKLREIALQVGKLMAQVRTS